MLVKLYVPSFALLSLVVCVQSVPLHYDHPLVVHKPASAAAGVRNSHLPVYRDVPECVQYLVLLDFTFDVLIFSFVIPTGGSKEGSPGAGAFDLSDPSFAAVLDSSG